MEKQKRREASLLFTKILCYIIFTAIVLVAIATPFFMNEGFCAMLGIEKALPVFLGALLYLSLPAAAVASAFLYKLLLNIEKDSVFCLPNIKYLGILSWCCFYVGVLYFAAGFFAQIMFLVSFAAIFFFFILRVIKSVFRTAYEIKQENDYTV